MATTDLITGVSTANARPQATTVTVSRAGGVSTLTVDALTGWETATAVHFQTYQLDPSTNEKVAGSEQDWKADVSGNTLINLAKTSDGADTGNSIGDVVVAMPTAGWADQLAQGLLVSLQPTGVLKPGSVSNTTLTDGSMSTAKIADDAVTDAKLVYGKIRGRQGGNATNHAAAGANNYDLSGTNTFIQYGVIGTDAGSDITVTFPNAYSQKPVVIVSTFGGNTGDAVLTQNVFAEVNLVTTTTFTCRTINDAGGQSNQAVAWIAIGV